MKKVFKKIGRGFRKLGRGLKKFFKSKIGRILGTIALAIALPMLFNAFFTGTVVTGSGATTAVEGLTTAAVEGTAAAGTTAAATAAATAAPTVGTIAATPTAIGMKQIVVQTAEQSIGLARRLQAVASQGWELFRHPIQAVQRTFQNIMGTNPELLTAERQTDFLNVLEKDKAMFLSTNEAGAITNSDVFLQGAEGISSEQHINNLFDSWARVHPNQAKASAIRLEASNAMQDMPEKWGGLADKRMSYFDEYTPGTSFKTERNLHTLMSHSTPRVQADILGIPGVRDAWTNAVTTTGRVDLFPDPASFAGVRPFSSLKEAWKSGSNPFESVGQTADQLLSSRVQDVVPGYKGWGSQASVYKAGTKVMTGASLLGQQEVTQVEPEHYNPYAARQAQTALDRAEEYSVTPTSNDPIDMYSMINNADPNQDALSIYNGILRNNQAGVAYGPHSLYG